MNDEGEDDETKTLLLGVRLACEMHSHDHNSDSCLGVIVSRNLAWLDSTLPTVRQEICHQLRAVPDSFMFLTSQGWPITRNQEESVKLCDIMACNEKVIYIQRSYGKPRVGVLTKDEKAVGFVFIDYTNSLIEMRHAIQDQLGLPGGVGGMSFCFIDRNGWPVVPDQESRLLVIDALRNTCVRIGLPTSHIDTVDSTSVVQTTSKVTKLKRSISTVTYDCKRQRLPLTFQCSVDEVRSGALMIGGRGVSKHKQILISYVRAEAADYALRLKRSLIHRGFSVFLDVHEIKFGADWQDALNNAVSSCEIFVPLVTARYGETLWTNREVKLADILAKAILPVSFLDYWPPKCLAIQFATTQYIMWKGNENTHKDSCDEDNNPTQKPRVWTDTEVRAVAGEIAERIKLFMSQKIVPADDKVHAPLIKQISSLRSYPVANANNDGLQLLTQPRDGRPLIFVSVHPAQNEFGKQLQSILTAVGDYEVLLSTQLLQLEAEDDLECGSQSMFDDDLNVLPFGLSEAPTQPMQFDTMSQKSGTSCRSSGLADRLRKFQEKADEAGVVIFVLSASFAESRFTREQVFYCEHRKRVIPVLYEDMHMPGWMSMLIGTRVFEDARAENFAELITNRVQKALNNEASADDQDEEANEEKLSALVLDLRQQMTDASEIFQRRASVSSVSEVPRGRSSLGRIMYVYISGSTRFYSDKSEAICRSIGEKLAEMDGVHVVTGGFSGVGDTVGRCYDLKRQELGRISNMWHVLPIRDSQDYSFKANQNSDKTFRQINYGRTVFIGHSVRQREMVTARAFDVCILVEGGPGAAHEVEQFAWSDHVVIPIKCTGGAAGGKFSVPGKIFEVPAGVDPTDWSVISGSACASSDQIGQAVLRILASVRDRLSLESPSNCSIISAPDFVDADHSDANSRSGGNIEELLTDDELISDDHC